jgi:predicted Zn-dependent protease
MPASIPTGNVAQVPHRRASISFEIGLPLLIALLITSPRTSAQGCNLSAQPGEIRKLPTGESDRIQQSTVRNAPMAPTKNNPDSQDACLLPPLNLTPPPLLTAQQLQTPASARKEYQRACVALKGKKGADAEKHLRNAVEDYPKYAAAWVTLGQLLVSQQKPQEGRGACARGQAVDTNYAPAYLCLAEVAAHAHDWGEVLNLSNRAIEIDSNNAVAYEYQAAANLNLHNLAEAEKGGLRAAEIDKNHRQPRVYFVLAQIYEAKREPANEAAQLREYLKYADNPDDVAIAKQSLADLEKQGLK